MSRLIACVSLALSVAACVGETPEHAGARSPIVDGELTEGLPQVVAITPRRVRCGSQSAVLCSGTLIARDAVLSAAHCFASMRPGLAYEVVIGSAVTPVAARVSVIEVVTHPGFDEVTRANDVAILWLADQVSGISPLPVPEPTSTKPALGERVELAGFGATSAGATPDGAKRVGVGRIASVEAGVVDVEPDPAVSCVGDSGGPLFGADGELVGVASSGDTGCRDNSVYARIAPTVEGFIEPTLAMGPAERPTGDACGIGCGFDQDCPVGFVCVPDLDTDAFVCTLPGEEAGSFGDRCAEDTACAARFCAVAEGSEGCRCYEPCGSSPTGSGGRGCTVSNGAGACSWIWLLALGAWAWFRSRPSAGLFTWSRQTAR
jgi:secreted trypsin-like serine protease